ncbi:hypothetical protein, partial [Phormidium sp. CCY1219]|uniref:hypothetical protein n=1 Tax=Phormidium sp. CCY1219 TaxID=2886104 RepID=UPI002D1F4C05
LKSRLHRQSPPSWTYSFYGYSTGHDIKRYSSGLETALPIAEVLAEPRSWPENNPVFKSR